MDTDNRSHTGAPQQGTVGLLSITAEIYDHSSQTLKSKPVKSQMHLQPENIIFISQCIHCAKSMVVNVLDVTMALNNRCV